MQPPSPSTAPADTSGPCREKSLPGLAVSSSCCHRDAQSFNPELSERCWGMELARASQITSFPAFKTSAALGISPQKGKCSTLVQWNHYFQLDSASLSPQPIPAHLCSRCCSCSHPAKPSSSSRDQSSCGFDHPLVDFSPSQAPPRHWEPGMALGEGPAALGRQWRLQLLPACLSL